MKVVRLHAPLDLRGGDASAPQPSQTEELVRIMAVGLCGSDRHWYVNGGIGDAKLDGPVVPGHELAGVVVGGPDNGRRVVVDPADPCEVCAACRAGNGHLCPDVRFAGHGHVDGGLRELMAWPASRLETTPDGLSHDAATLLEPLGVALHAVDLGRVRPATGAGVYGCGPIGLLLVQVLAMMGCSPIVATDLTEHRVDAARRLGATHGYVETSLDAIANRPDLPAIDVAFEAAGEDAALAAAVGDVRPGGRIVLVGIPSTDRTSFTASRVRRHELTLVACRRMTPEDLRRAVHLADNGHVELEQLVTGRHPLGEAVEAFEALVRRDGLKTVINPSTDH